MPASLYKAGRYVFNAQLGFIFIKNSNRREILSPQFSPAGLRVEPTFVVIIGSKFGTWDSNFVVATAGGGQCPQSDMGSLSMPTTVGGDHIEHCSTLLAVSFVPRGVETDIGCNCQNL